MSRRRPTISTLALILLAISFHAHAQPHTRMPTRRSPIPFEDVTDAVGIRQPANSENFGGATVADVNCDGHYDLILSFHNAHPMEVFFGTANGTFVPSGFTMKTDIHGATVAHRTARTRAMLMAISVGGRRPHRTFLVRPRGTFRNVTLALGLGQEIARGRIPLFMDLTLDSPQQRRRNLGGPDLLVINFLRQSDDSPRHFAYQNVRGNFRLREVPGLSFVHEGRGTLTDIDGDGIMELILYGELHMLKLVAPFTFQNATTDMWPGARFLGRSVSAVAELDFNNDGLMDLYLARTDTEILSRRNGPPLTDTDDVLLMNQGGRYVDVSRMAGIPRGTESVSVSVEDFDNDGYVDIFITTFIGPDMILLNQGDGTFRRINPRTNKPQRRRGANVMAMDYDLDGRVDYIVQHGLRTLFLGNFRLMKNMMPLGANNNYLLVRVGHEPSRATTALHALVTLTLPRGQRMIRRVGGRGARAGAPSLIDTVHFGLGSATRVRRVTVVWTTRASETMTGVRANGLISFGRGQ